MDLGGAALSPLWLAASGAASKAASSAAGAARPGFDPASTLGWAVPILLLAPLLGFLLLVSGVRTRRSAANLAALTALVVLGASLLAGWALVHRELAYVYSFPYISIAPAFSGASQFQTFQVDVSVRADHVALAGLAAVCLVFLASMYWNRAGGRADTGPVRMQVLSLLFLFCAAGVVVAGDLAELFGFWALAGATSWLLLAHRWGVEPAAAPARLALALPFLGDLSLLLGVGLLYSRYGHLDLDRLTPVLLTTPGVGLKTLGAACVLIFVGVAARAALVPFSAWQTRTLESPPAAVALLQGSWPILAGVLLFRILPILAAAGPEARHAAAYGAGGAALAAALLGLLGSDLRRSLSLLGSAAAGLGLLAVVSSGGSIGVAVLLAVGLARATISLAGASMVAAVRSLDLADGGEAWTRMRRSSLALALGCAALTLGAAAGGAWRGDGASWRSGVVMAAVLILGLGAGRAWFAFSSGRLRRRRAFEPDRVRDPVLLMAGPPLALGAGALLLAAAAFAPGWVRFLARTAHASPSLGVSALWAGVAVVAFAVAGAVLLTRRDAALAWTARLGGRLGAGSAGLAAVLRAILADPALGLVDGLERRLLARGEGSLGASLDGFGGALGSSRWGRPALPALFVLLVALALAVGLLSPGLAR